MEETALRVVYLAFVGLVSMWVTYLVYKPSAEPSLSELGEMTIFCFILFLSLAILGFLIMFLQESLENLIWTAKRERFEEKATELGYTAEQLDSISYTIWSHLHRNPGATTDELLGRVNNPLFGYNDETVEAFKLAGFVMYEGYGQDYETGQWYTTEAHAGVKKQSKDFQKETKLLASKLLRR